jgi:hypothetical protein
LNYNETNVDIAGKTHQEEWPTTLQQVSEDYFRVLRIEFKQGRGFSEAEINDARKVAVVNETFQRKYLSNEKPIGQRVRLASFETMPDAIHDGSFEIIGVVGDVTNRGLQTPIEPEVWVPYTVTRSGIQAVIVRTSQDPGTMMHAVQQGVWATDSGVALAFAGTLDDRINQRLYAGPRFGFLLMTIFGCV